MYIYMRRLILIFNTLKFLKFKQIYYRLKRKFINPKVTEKFLGDMPQRKGNWIKFNFYEDKIDKDLNANFLNCKKKLNLPKDWNNLNISKLWTYNLHYFDDLLSINADSKNDFHINLLELWIDQNPQSLGNGWEPYPSSLRIVNIFKAWLGGLNLNDKIFRSLHTQTSFLSNNLEKHLLGNHYFVNLKALLFAGIIFKEFRWVDIAIKGLTSEISEQILDDGANFELSPMYHSIMLVDILDIYNLYLEHPTAFNNELIILIKTNIPKMLKFMDIMSHPDQKLAAFNDSADEIAPSKKDIEEYARKLGFKITSLDINKTQIFDNNDSGYFCATNKGSKIIFDASHIGPDYIPGHAHADTLSFEFSIGYNRVFVNSGTSLYGLSSERLKQRKTKSHNTVEIDNKDSSQVWSSFRVGNRAKILSRNSRLINNEVIELEASHDGYKTLCGGSIHTRKITLNSNKLIINDSIKGSYTDAKAYFYIHPCFSLKVLNNTLNINSSDLKLKCNLDGIQYSVLDSLWSPQFGIQLPNKVLEINFESKNIETIFSWQ